MARARAADVGAPPASVEAMRARLVAPERCGDQAQLLRAFDLPIVRTVEPPADFDGKAYTGEGPAINSGFLDGLGVAEAKSRMTDWLVERGLAPLKAVADRGVPDARHDAELLLRDLLQLDSGGLLLRRDEPLADDVAERYRNRVARRSSREPLAGLVVPESATCRSHCRI